MHMLLMSSMMELLSVPTIFDTVNFIRQ